MALQITITDAGRAEVINANNTGTGPVTIAEVGLGTGQYAPDPTQVALVAETQRLNTIAGQVVADDTIHVTVKDETGAAYTVNEFGLYTDSGTLFAVYSDPVSPIAEKAAASSLLLAVDVVLGTLDANSLTFGDTSFTLPPASETVKGVAEIATQAETDAGDDDTRMVTPKKLKGRLDQLMGGNWLVNPSFQFNLRSFAGGALAAGAYGHNRWKAGAGGANYSESGGIVTLNSGSLVQETIGLDLAGMKVVLSADVQAGVVTGTIAGQSGPLPLAVTIPAGDPGPYQVELSGNGTQFTDVKLEPGSQPTKFYPRPYAIEAVLVAGCYRSGHVERTPLQPNGSANTTAAGVQFGVPMVAAPDIYLNNVLVGRFYNDGGGGSRRSPNPAAVYASKSGFSISMTDALLTTGALATDVSFLWIADCEP